MMGIYDGNSNTPILEIEFNNGNSNIPVMEIEDDRLWWIRIPVMKILIIIRYLLRSLLKIPSYHMTTIITLVIIDEEMKELLLHPN